MWHGFWIATVVILIVVAFVGTVVALVNRVERQAAQTVLHLSAGKEASSAFEDLVEANVHLRAVARAGLASASVAAKAPKAGARRRNVASPAVVGAGI
jgi:hypothetical protein